MKLLICNDGSEQAERATRLGAGIAAGCGASVTLLGISERPRGGKEMLDLLKSSQALLEEKKIDAELVTKTGDPVEEIVRRTIEINYDLVIIGAVRKETRGLFWMSSKSYKIIKAIQPPVLSVAGKCTQVRRVLICSGGKRYIDQGVLLAGKIARGVGATVTLLHITPELPAIYAQLPRMEEDTSWLLASRSELGQNLAHEKKSLEDLGVQTGVHLRQGSVLDQMLAEARQGEYDMIVVGSAPSRTLRTYVLGDVSREIVNRANCAVLVARSQIPSLFNFRSFFGRFMPITQPKSQG